MKILGETNFSSIESIINSDMFSIAKVFHENTKQWRYELELNKIKIKGKTDYVKRLLLNQTLHNTSELTKIISNSSKKFKGFTSYKVYEKIKSQSLNIIEIIEKRHSERKFTGENLDIIELSTLLNSYKTTSKIENTEIFRRAIPSGGALYPLELYLTLPSSVNKSLLKGVYYYNPKNHSLVFLNSNPKIRKVKNFLFQPDIQVEKSAVVFYITGILNKSYWKYGDRAYRYMLLEAGHLAQNILLLGSSINLGCCPIGGFNDNEVNSYLGLDSLNEVTLYIIVIGKL